MEHRKGSFLASTPLSKRTSLSESMNRFLGRIKVVDVPTDGANFIWTVVRLADQHSHPFMAVLTFPHSVDDHRLLTFRLIQLSYYQWLALVVVVPSAGCFVDYSQYFLAYAVVDGRLLPDSNKRIAVWLLHLPSSSAATLSFFVLRRFVHLLNKKNKANVPGHRRRTTSMRAS
jgi:hypothetical protein